MRGTRIRAFRLRHEDVRGVTHWLLPRQQVLRSLWNRNTAKGLAASGVVHVRSRWSKGLAIRRNNPERVFCVQEGAASRYASPAEAAGALKPMGAARSLHTELSQSS